MVVELDRLCGVGNLHPSKGNGRITYREVFMVRYPRGSHIVLFSLSLEVTTLENKLTRRRCHP